MSRPSSPVPSRWVVIVLAAAAIALAGCGRKGALEPPPGEAALPPSKDSLTHTGTPAVNTRQSLGVLNAGPGIDSGPKASRGQKRPFFLDPLLND